MAVLETRPKQKAIGDDPPYKRLGKRELLRRHAEALEKQPGVNGEADNSNTPRGVKRPDLDHPYHASTKSIRDLEKIPLRSLKPDTHHRGQVIVVRAVALPFNGAGTVTVVEDEHGDADKLVIYAHSDSSILSNIPEGCFVAVKEPYYRAGEARDVEASMDFVISVDHPSDILLLRFGDPIIPQALRESAEHPLLTSLADWKKAGDASFLQGDLATAVFCYTEALDFAKPEETDLKASIFSKRAGTNLLLGRWDAAKEDALSSRNGGPQDWRAYSTAAKAAYALGNFHSALGLLDSALFKTTTAPAPEGSSGGSQAGAAAAAQLKKERDRTMARIHEEKTGEYDFAALGESVSLTHVHLDAANFLRRTVVRRSATHGRGLFAAEDVAAGELVFVEKATVFPNQYEENQTSAALYATAVRRLYDNPTLARRLAPLWAGEGYNYPACLSSSSDDGTAAQNQNGEKNNEEEDEDGVAIVVDGNSVVDVFRVEQARLKNCFSSPHTTLGNTRQLQQRAPLRGSDRGGDYGGPPEDDDDAPPKQAKGIWAHAANMNHACAANTMRAFAGDLMIVRASKSIKRGEEITQQYVPVKADVQARQEQFRSWWGFECGCALCTVEMRESETTTTTAAASASKAAASSGIGNYDARRREALRQIENLATKIAKTLEQQTKIRRQQQQVRGQGQQKLNDLKQHNGANHVPDATIRSMEKLTRQLEEAHEEAVYGPGVVEVETGKTNAEAGTFLPCLIMPRLMLVFPTLWLIEAHRARRNHKKVVQQVLKLLRNFGFAVPVVHAEAFVCPNGDKHDNTGTSSHKSGSGNTAGERDQQDAEGERMKRAPGQGGEKGKVEEKQQSPPPPSAPAASTQASSSSSHSHRKEDMASLFQAQPRSSRAVMTVHVVRALKQGANSLRSLGGLQLGDSPGTNSTVAGEDVNVDAGTTAEERAEAWEEAARFGFMIVTGWENDAGELVARDE